jgi:hypothetical protein
MESAPPPRIDAEMLRIFLMERDAPCAACGYNLRGLNVDKCPECAEPLALALSARPAISRRKRAWILALSWTALASFLMSSAVSSFSLWQNWSMYQTAAFGLPAYFLVHQIANVVLETGLAIAMVVALAGLFGRAPNAPRRLGRCFQITVTCLGVQLAFGLLQTVSYFFFL